MRILIVHNKYQQPGGEDVVVEQETALLREKGHTVIEYYRTNHEIEGFNLWEKVSLPKRTVWASKTSRDLSQKIRQEKPDVAHFHNTFLMISPAAYYRCQQAGVPVVQTLHNYRLLCPSATLFRNQKICEDCLQQTWPWPGILHACYRDSHLQSATVATMLTVHRWLKTWQEQVDLYLTPTTFAREKFIQGGLPPSKIAVKANFVYPDPGLKDEAGEYALFVGRLSEAKGVKLLLRTWQALPDIPLKIVGHGPLWNESKQFLETQPRTSVELLGQRSQKEVITLLKKARFLIQPSALYETFGLVIAEAFACGVPVITSGLGALAEIVEDGRTGLHFLPNHPQDLATKVEWAWTHSQEMRKMGQEARQEFEAKYSADKNYELLMTIYRQVTARSTSPKN